MVLGSGATFSAALIVTGLVLFGIMTTLAVSWLLSRTLLQGVPSSFTLELPPYRKPQFFQTIVRSICDRTLFVLRRAIFIAIPAGALIWLMANVYFGGTSLLAHAANFLDPFGRLLGLDGYILMAFILGLPANEIVMPILIMSYTVTGTMTNLDSLTALHHLFVVEHGWTWLTVVCTMLFSLLHYPCGTTVWTIYKESGSLKWTALAVLIPLGIAVLICTVLAQSVKLLGLV